MTFQPADLAACLLIALACSGIAISFTQGSMFEPIRSWIERKNKLLGELARCFFCFSHWLAFAGVAVYQPRPLHSSLVADLVLSAFVIVTMATLAAGLMFGAFLAAGNFHLLRERLLQAKKAA